LRRGKLIEEAMEVLKKSQKISKRNPKDLRLTLVSESARRVYYFGPFRLNETERLLLRQGEIVLLTPKVFDILLLLVQNSGSLVSKEMFLDKIWPDAFVEEANLTVNVASLRKALREDPTEHQYIETVPKRGYRFVAAVKIGTESIRPNPMWDRRAVSTAQKQRSEDNPEAFNSIAVLPFENVSADPNAEYLSDGLAESIISRLAQLTGLRVMARDSVFRYKGKGLDALVIGQELGVRSILSGRILQLEDRIVVRTELVDAVNGWQIWGEQYHRTLSDILAVQEEISGAISARLKVQLTREEKDRLGKRYTENAEAYRFYLKGRYHWNKFHPSSLRRATEYFEQAIQIDPTYALAYAGLADSYYRLSNVYAHTRDAMPKAKTAAIKALEIDETLSEGHAALGLIRMFYDWDWLGANEEFARAIEINPNNATAHQRFGLYFNLFGRFEEAMREQEMAFAIDPLSEQVYWSFALSFFLGRKNEQAIGEIQKALDLDGNYQPALYLLGRVYVELGQLAEAIAVFKKLLGLNDAPMFLAALGHAYARAGKHRDTRNVLNELREQSEQRYVSAYGTALIHLALGDKNMAFSYLEQAYENRCEMMSWLKVDPALDSIRTDLRFINLLRRLGLDREYQILRKSATS